MYLNGVSVHIMLFRSCCKTLQDRASSTVLFNMASVVALALGLEKLAVKEDAKLLVGDIAVHEEPHKRLRPLR